MSEPRGLRSSHLVALAGAGLAVASLWAPWYRVHLPPALRGLLQGSAGPAGTPRNDFLQSLAALIPDSVSANAWQVFSRTDVVVALLAGFTIAALLAHAGGLGAGVRVDGDAAARIATVCGAIGALAVGGRIADTPGPGAYVDVRWGAWACLAGFALMSPAAW